MSNSHGGLKYDGIKPVSHVGGADYVTVAASQTGATVAGQVGDTIEGVLIVPATVDPGNVILNDGGTAITIFAGGTGSVGSLHSFYVPVGAKCVNAAWTIDTGADVSVVAIGHF